MTKYCLDIVVRRSLGLRRYAASDARITRDNEVLTGRQYHTPDTISCSTVSVRQATWSGLSLPAGSFSSLLIHGPLRLRC